MGVSRINPPRNFRSYGNMEAGCIILVPALAWYFGRPSGLSEAIAIGLAIVASAGVLLIGAVYWWSMDQRLRGDRRLLARWLVLADRAEKPLLGLIGLTAFAAAAALALNGWTSAIVAALVLTLLAGLEYINYYHWQLQHFDNLADFKRLVATRRLRRAHSARDLGAYRRSSR